MTYTVVNNPPPPHECGPRPTDLQPGAIITCDECGLGWVLRGDRRWYTLPKPPPVAHPKYVTQRSWWKR